MIPTEELIVMGMTLEEFKEFTDDNIRRCRDIGDPFVDTLRNIDRVKTEIKTNRNDLKALAILANQLEVYALKALDQKAILTGIEDEYWDRVPGSREKFEEWSSQLDVDFQKEHPEYQPLR